MTLVKRKPSERYASIAKNAFARLGDTDTIIDAINAITDGFLYQGTLDCSGNPNYPAATQDQFWAVSGAGKVGGGSGVDVEVGDLIFCLVTNSGGDHATVGADFAISQTNIDPATVTELRTGTSDAVYVTPNVLADAFNGGSAFTAATDTLILSGGSANQLQILTTAARNGILITGTAKTASDLTINTAINSASVNAVAVNISFSTALSGAENCFGVYSSMTGLNGNADTSGVSAYGAYGGAVSGDRADYCGYGAIISSIRDTADTDQGVYIITTGTMNNAGATTYGARISSAGFTHTNGDYYGIYVSASHAVAAGNSYGAYILTGTTSVASIAAANSATAVYINYTGGYGINIIADTNGNNALYGIQINKGTGNATAIGAVLVSNNALVVSQNTTTSAAASGATTVSNRQVFFSQANTTSVAMADVYSGVVTNIYYSADTTGAGTATNSATGILVDYNLVETAGTLSNSAFNVARIDYDTQGTLEFAAGSYNMLSITADDAGVPVYAASSILSGISVNMSGLSVADADLTLYGMLFTLPAGPYTSSYATIASVNTLKMVTTDDTKTITLNSRNYAATTGDLIGFQSKPAANVSGTQTVYGGQISPRFNDNIDGTALVGLQVEPILKGASVLALTGDMRGLDVRLTSEGANTVGGIAGGLFLYNLLPASTYTGGVFPIVVTASGSTQEWSGLMKIPTGVCQAAAAGATATYIKVDIGGVAYTITALTA